MARQPTAGIVEDVKNTEIPGIEDKIIYEVVV